MVGVLLAAGAGRRLGLGTSKALVTDERGRSWLDRSVAALRDGGVAEVYVVVGAEAAAVEAAIPAGCVTVLARDWQEGMGASLRTGLDAVQRYSPDADAVVVMLVDTPGVGADVVRRVVAHKAPNALARAGVRRCAGPSGPDRPRSLARRTRCGGGRPRGTRVSAFG